MGADSTFDDDNGAAEEKDFGWLVDLSMVRGDEDIGEEVNVDDNRAANPVGCEVGPLSPAS